MSGKPEKGRVSLNFLSYSCYNDPNTMSDEGKLEKMEKDFSPQVDALLPETESLTKVNGGVCVTGTRSNMTIDDDNSF